MASARASALVVVALLAGLPAGYGLAGAANTPPNDACANFGSLPEGSTSSSKLVGWPLGVHCEYYGTAGERRSESFGPSRGETLAWMAMASLLGLIALRMRRSAVVRGATAGAALLGLVGLAWVAGGIIGAVWAAVVLGTPIVFAIEHLLRPVGQRSWRASAVTALALVPATIVLFLVVKLGGLPLWCAIPKVVFSRTLVDELRMFRYPVVVGGGRPFLPPVTADVPLELIETRTIGSRAIYERYGRSRDASD